MLTHAIALINRIRLVAMTAIMEDHSLYGFSLGSPAISWQINCYWGHAAMATTRVGLHTILTTRLSARIQRRTYSGYIGWEEGEAAVVVMGDCYTKTVKR